MIVLYKYVENNNKNKFFRKLTTIPEAVVRRHDDSMLAEFF